MTLLRGKSGWAVAKEIADGYLTLNAPVVRRLSAAESGSLRQEIERRLRGVRGEQPDLSDSAALRDRNRRIQRMSAALTVLDAARRARR